MARSYTEIDGFETVAAFLAAIGENRTRQCGPAATPKHLVQTVYSVARTLQMQLEIARRNNRELEMITCGPEPEAYGTTNFTPIGIFEMPESEGMKLYYPPPLKMLHYC